MFCFFLHKTVVNMAASISKFGHNANNNNELEYNNDIPTTGTTSSYAGIANTMEMVDKLINKQKVKEDRVQKLHPGYLPDQYQDSIISSKLKYSYAQQGWKAQNFIQFKIDVNDRSRYNPSTARLLIKFKVVSNTGGNLPEGVIPVENFEKKMFEKIKIENAGTGDDVNRAIEYNTDLIELTEHFFLDEEDYKHSEEKRNQFLCESLGRRLKAKQSNKRLTARMKQHGVWKDKDEWILDLSRIDEFFKINHLLWAPITITFYFQTNMKKLFEKVPTAAVVDNNVYDEPAKILFDDSFTPQLIYGEYFMSELYATEDAELYERNGLYDLGEYNKVTIEQQNIQKGAQSVNVFVKGLTNRVDYLAISLKSLTGQEHGSVYDSTYGDKAMALIEKVIIKNVNTPEGSKTYTTIFTNDVQNKIDLLESYGNFCRFVSGCPVLSTPAALRHTNYFRNLPTLDDYLSRRSITKANTDGCYPMIFDLSDSKGNFDDSKDNPNFVTPILAVEIVLKNNATQNYNVVITAFQKGKYVLHNRGKIPCITKL